MSISAPGCLSSPLPSGCSRTPILLFCLRQDTMTSPACIRFAAVSVPALPGDVVTWDGRGWRIANIGGTTVALLSEDGSLLELPDATVESLVKQGRITLSPEPSQRRGMLTESPM